MTSHPRRRPDALDQPQGIYDPNGKRLSTAVLRARHKRLKAEGVIQPLDDDEAGDAGR